MTEDFDAIIIGAGQAGPSLADRLSKAGWRVALIERDRFGGTCVNTGCTPTKTLAASARVAATVRRSHEYGISVEGKIAVDFESVMARMDRVSGNSSRNVEKWLRAMPGVTVIAGHARFEGPDTVRVGARLLRSRHCFINVGGRAAGLPDSVAGGVRVLNNSSLLALAQLPEHLVVVGGSYVGLEFAQMFRRFGSQVTVLQRGAQIVPREDADVARTLQDILEAEGIELRLQTECIAMQQEGDRISVRARCDDKVAAVRCTHVLNATGRRPNTDDLGLESAGVRLDARGYVEVDDQLCTSVPGIWALGDCNGKGAFTHTAYNDYEIVAANLLDDDPRGITDRFAAYALYTDPPLARIGITAAEALRSGRRILIGQRSMAKVSRAIEKGETQGFMRVLVDAQSQQLLGAALLGVEGDETIHSLLTLMYSRQPVSTVQRAVFIHPTVSELLPTVLQSLQPLEALPQPPE